MSVQGQGLQENLQWNLYRKGRHSNVITGKLSDMDYIKQALDSKLASDYSVKYKAMLQFSFNCLEQEIGSSKLDVTALKNILFILLWSFSQHP